MKHGRVEMITLIRTSLTRRGDGKDTPIRYVTQYWDLDGNFVFEIDNFKEEQTCK